MTGAGAGARAAAHAAGDEDHVGAFAARSRSSSCDFLGCLLADVRVAACAQARVSLSPMRMRWAPGRAAAPGHRC